MPTKNLYYSEDDKPLVEAAKRVAKRKRISFSRLVTEALESHVPKAAAESAPANRWDDIAAESNAA